MRLRAPKGKSSFPGDTWLASQTSQWVQTSTTQVPGLIKWLIPENRKGAPTINLSELRLFRQLGVLKSYQGDQIREPTIYTRLRKQSRSFIWTCVGGSAYMTMMTQGLGPSLDTWCMHQNQQDWLSLGLPLSSVPPVQAADSTGDPHPSV